MLSALGGETGGGGGCRVKGLGWEGLAAFGAAVFGGAEVVAAVLAAAAAAAVPAAEGESGGPEKREEGEDEQDPVADDEDAIDPGPGGGAGESFDEVAGAEPSDIAGFGGVGAVSAEEPDGAWGGADVEGEDVPGEAGGLGEIPLRGNDAEGEGAAMGGEEELAEADAEAFCGVEGPDGVFVQLVIGEVEGAAIGEAENMSLVVDGGVSPIAGKPEGQQHGWKQEQGRETEASHGVGIVPPPRVSGSV